MTGANTQVGEEPGTIVPGVYGEEWVLILTVVTALND